MPYRQNFPIPDVINPPRTCLCIEIPDNAQWRAVIAGTLGELRYWYNWERTGDNSGALCAAVWKEVFDSIDWSDMSCCCDEPIPVQFRYTVVGVLQISIDGGVTWEDAPEYDTRLNSPQFPPVSGDDGEDKRCVAATGMTNLIREQVGDNLTEDMSRYNLGQLISDWVTTMINTSNPFEALLTVVTNQLFALVMAVLIPALDSTAYDLLLCIFFCNMGDDASFDDGQWQTVRSDITDQIGGVAGVFFEHLVYLLGVVGLSNLARAAGSISGDCSGCSDCVEPECAASNWTNYGGALIETGDDYLIVESELAPAYGSQTVGIYLPEGECCYFSLVEDVVGEVPLFSGWSLCDEEVPLPFGASIAHSHAGVPPCDVPLNMVVFYGGGTTFQIKITLSGTSC